MKHLRIEYVKHDLNDIICQTYIAIPMIYLEYTIEIIYWHHWQWMTPGLNEFNNNDADRENLLTTDIPTTKPCRCTKCNFGKVEKLKTKCIIFSRGQTYKPS